MESPRGSRRSRQPSLAAQARLMIVRESLFRPEDGVLLMVSGGQDSTAMLELCATGALGKSRPRRIRVLHINHHLRGEESDADEALVRAHCLRLEVPLTVVHRPIAKAVGNVQERARAARREAAGDTAARYGCERIALAHTADDQVENLLYRVGRYGGPAALRGMLPCDPPWVRPLLTVRREETARFCRERGIEYAVDCGNVYPGYARTGIREQVLPAWEAVLPGAMRSATRTAEVTAEVERLVSTVVARSGVDVTSPGLEVAVLRALPVELRRLVIRAWLEQHEGLAVTRASVLVVEEALGVPGSSCRDLSGGWRVCRENDWVWVERAEATPLGSPTTGPVAPVSLPLPGRAEWIGAVVRAERTAVFFAPDPAREAYVDAHSISGPLEVRGPLPGDRLHPLGAAGTRKIHDIFVDMRVPARVRAQTPLVVCGEHIVWVAGLVVAERGRIRADTVDLVRFSLEGAEL
ncbi:MAG: tRNA lysidine(34) synthetase TilS [Thermoleophilia bacterium]